MSQMRRFLVSVLFACFLTLTPVVSADDLLINGNFSDGLAGWTVFIYPGCAGDRTVTLLPIDGANEWILQAKSTGAGGCGGSSEIYQDVDLWVDDYQSIVLTAAVKAVFANVGGGCGWLGGEYPVDIVALYEDAQGAQKFLHFGFYYSGGSCGHPTPDPEHVWVTTGVAQNQWSDYRSPDIKTLIPDAVRIYRLVVRGNGWDYEGRVDAVQLLAEPKVLTAAMDIKPGGCPNPVNTTGRGVLPVAILGSPGFDVFALDPASLKLEGTPALRLSYDDELTYIPSADQRSFVCPTAAPDGHIDLLLKFDLTELMDNLGYRPRDREARIMKVTGRTMDGRPFEAQDLVIFLVNKK